MVIGDLLGAVRFPLSCDGFLIVLEIIVLNLCNIDGYI